MAETPTPGQVAHATYWLTFAGRPPTLPWAQLIPENRAAWEAAAQAVLARPQTQGEAIVAQINAREAASLEALRREMEEEEPRTP